MFLLRFNRLVCQFSSWSFVRNAWSGFSLSGSGISWGGDNVGSGLNNVNILWGFAHGEQCWLLRREKNGQERNSLDHVRLPYLLNSIIRMLQPMYSDDLCNWYPQPKASTSWGWYPADVDQQQIIHCLWYSSQCWLGLDDLRPEYKEKSLENVFQMSLTVFRPYSG